MTLWTQDDIQKMNDMILMKKSFTKIAKELGKSPLAVKYKFGRLYRKKIKERSKHNEVEDKDEDEDKDDSEEMDDVDNDSDSESEIKPHIQHKRTFSEESDPSIYVKYSPPITTCALFTFVVSGGLSILICGTAVFMSTLLDSLNRIQPS